jgi:1,2-dihydroxy-3-keto-5-methylthiopentene dioxygenase
MQATVRNQTDARVTRNEKTKRAGRRRSQQRISNLELNKDKNKMSVLRIYPDTDTTQLEFTTERADRIQQQLQAVGVRFEQWPTQDNLKAGAESDAVMKAYTAEIEQLKTAEGYQTVDLISLDASHPKKDELRQVFLREHTHSEDEVRFFVAGQGLFSLHIEKRVYEVLCQQGDLISVPANTPHWFDMGPNPELMAIRFFNNPEGWVANYTDSDIAERFNRLEN